MKRASGWQRWAAPCGVLIALLGAWTSHTLEFLRVYGLGDASAVSPSPFGRVHAYMLPLAVLLLALASWSGTKLWKVWWRLTRRVDLVRAQLSKSLWNATNQPLDDTTEVSTPSRLLGIWTPLFVTQVVVYLIQENAEALATHHTLPGIGVFVGVHWAAPLIHAMVALLFAVGIVLATRPVARVSAQLSSLARLVARIIRSRAPRHLPVTVITEFESISRIMGSSIWQRPPPSTV